MHQTHEHARTTSLRVPRSWRSPSVVVVAVVLIGHGIFFYGGRQDPYATSANDRFLAGNLSDKFQTIFRLGRVQNI